ncbi:MAG: SEC-C metal-binding domain-containing protein [Planctomycetota bacterium]|nr:SEC-C metal-binding domain-containing protein [Planctomycetota bacterium]
MDTITRIWELITAFFLSIVNVFDRIITSTFGSSNKRQVDQYSDEIVQINDLEPKYQAMSDEELRQQTELFRDRLKSGQTLEDIRNEAFAVAREAGRRFMGMRHYDVQLIGGLVLHDGKIAEMVTGEGKTLVATLPAYLNALTGEGVHVVTVNDYLARRDMEWMAPLFLGLGLTIGNIQSDMPVRDRQAAYSCDITYGTNNEFGFDYLRDNMRPAANGDDRFPEHQQQSQGKLNYAIVDEVDNILIDEARTPLIISGPAHDNLKKYDEANVLAKQLKKDDHFIVNEKDHSVNLTDEGIRHAEKLAGVESFYTAGNMEWPHLIDNALKAHFLYKNDVNYVVRDEKIIIVDQFTGRLMDGRQWSDGLHQAVEAKEGVKIKEETQTLATITLQNYFKLYEKIAGMTGTALTEAHEFWDIYKMNVVAIPTNRPMKRDEFRDVIYLEDRHKFKAVADEVEQIHKWDTVVMNNGDEFIGTVETDTDSTVVLLAADTRKRETFNRSDVSSIRPSGRPILVGTVSIEKSEVISEHLEKRGIKHEVLNAKNHGREADIIAQAGRRNAVTIATNMAGRGTDIVLGGNPETLAWSRLQSEFPTRLDVPQERWDSLVREIDEEYEMSTEGENIKGLGGLHVIGTERHDARRIDLQLRGRCGRQGDPGSSRFFLSLDDDLMRIFGGDSLKGLLAKIGMGAEERIESGMVSRRIESAQKKVEERNFEIRKNLLEYDEVMDTQRKRVYAYRQEILDGDNVSTKITDCLGEQIDYYLHLFLDPNYGVDSYATWANNRFGMKEESRMFSGMDVAQAHDEARRFAIRAARIRIRDGVEENLPPDFDEEEWNWEALVKLVNSNWETSLRVRDLQTIDKDDLEIELLAMAEQAIEQADLSESEIFLEEDYGKQSLAKWVKNKFGFDINLSDIQDHSDEELVAIIHDMALEMYTLKEAEYPVIASIYHFTTGNDGRLDRENLIRWANERFDAEIANDSFRSMQREEIREMLLDLSLASQKRSNNHRNWVTDIVTQHYDGQSENNRLDRITSGAEIAAISLWLREHVNFEISVEDLGQYNRKQLARVLSSSVEDKHHQEMRRMERSLLLQIVDMAWKDHLLTMDRLRSSVGLQGYAQKDPKVEYKREGMKLYDDMWFSLGEQVTDLIFRIEQLNADFVGSTWVESSASHDQAQSSSDMARQQGQPESTPGQDDKTHTIRNIGPKVGRNDPCPCGSGKKYKKCCLGK